MTTDHSFPFLMTAVASWTRARSGEDARPLLEVTVKRLPNPRIEECMLEELRIDLPRGFKPGTTLIGPDPTELTELKTSSTLVLDSSSTPWEIGQRINGETWIVTLSHTQPENLLPQEWSLSLVLLVETPQNASTGELIVDADGAKSRIPFSIEAKPTPAPWLVRLGTNPENTNALRHGQEVVLEWEVKNIHGQAELRGSLPGANTIRLANGETGQRTIRVLGESVYTLTATVMQDGQLIEVVRRVHINLETLQSGVTLEFIPAAVFPGGPIVCFRSAYNIKKLEFTRTRHEPSLSAHHYAGKETTIVGTFVLPYGPKEMDMWALGATYGSRDGERTALGNTIKAIAPTLVEDSEFYNLPQAFSGGDSAIVHGMAAGTYFVQSAGRARDVAKRQWVASATSMGLALWVKDSTIGALDVVPEVQERKWVKKWLTDALAGEFLGVGASANEANPDAEDIIAVRRNAEDSRITEIIEIQLPLSEQNEYRTVLTITDSRFLEGAVRVLSLGRRVFLIGRAVALSYEPHEQTGASRNESWLSMVASPAWEIVALPAPRPEMGSVDGHLFALEKMSGILLRFDVNGGIVQPPRMAARANGQVAKLDALQRAQACLDPHPPAFPRDQLEEGRGYTGKDTDGTILQYLNPITAESRMMVVGRALLARSEVVDPSVSNTIQDRAYDPRLDVWVRCGHPFSAATSGSTNHFASTRETIYCRIGEALWYIEGALSSYLGFVSSDDGPIDAQSLAAPKWIESSLSIWNETPCALLFLGGTVPKPMELVEPRCTREVHFERLEGLALYRLTWGLRDTEAGGEPIARIDIDLNAEGQVETTIATAETTGRKLSLCQWDGRTLTIAPSIWRFCIEAESNVALEFSYEIKTPGMLPIRGNASTPGLVDVPSLVGETACVVDFKYVRGKNVPGSSVSARVHVIFVAGGIAQMRWEGKDAGRFSAEIDGGNTLQIFLDKPTYRG